MKNMVDITLKVFDPLIKKKFGKTKSDATHIRGSDPAEYSHIFCTHSVEPASLNHVYKNQVGTQMHTQLHADGYQVKKHDQKTKYNSYLSLYYYFLYCNKTIPTSPRRGPLRATLEDTIITERHSTSHLTSYKKCLQKVSQMSHA